MSTQGIGNERSGTRGPLGWVAVALHVAVGVFPYLASGLVAPPAGLALLALLWIALFVVVWRWRPTPAALLLAVPVVAIALWFAVLAVGEAVFGWTA